MSIADQIEQLWTGFLQFLQLFLVPDWGALINLLPLFLVLGVIGPLASLGMLIWAWYFLKKPRVKVRYEEGPTPLPIGPGGEPIPPKGLPFSLASGLVYPPGTNRGDAGEDLSVICPMCGVGRDAAIDTCGNCGLVLKVERRVRVVSAAPSPPPGGAALA